MGNEMLEEKDLDLFSVSEEVNSWIRTITFTWQGEEQQAEVKWEEGYGYELVDSEFTEKFKDYCDLHDIGEEQICGLLDDITWIKVRESNTWNKGDN
jgi:hypothetical protein